MPHRQCSVNTSERVPDGGDALRAGGVLATISTHHVAGASWNQTFFDEVQACYERWDPATPPGLLAHLMKQGKRATAAIWEAQKSFLESTYADETPRPRGLER